MKFDKLFLNLYLIAAIVHLYSVAAMMTDISILTKYILMPMLILHVIAQNLRNIRIVILLILALLFSWFGDVILIYTTRNENYFLFGLSAFLIAHIFYIFCFRRFTDKLPAKLSRFWFVVIALYSVGLIIWLYPYLGEFLIPVIVYSIAITAMAIAAASRFSRTTDYSFLFVMSGAAAFIISDSLIAVNKFISPVNNGSLLIMITYIVAQYLIVTGCLMHIRRD